MQQHMRQHLPKRVTVFITSAVFVPCHALKVTLLQKTWRKVEAIHKHPRGHFETTEVVSLHDV